MDATAELSKKSTAPSIGGGGGGGGGGDNGSKADVSEVVESAIASAKSKLDRGVITQAEFDEIVLMSEKMAAGNPAEDGDPAGSPDSSSPKEVEQPGALKAARTLASTSTPDEPPEPPMVPSAISFPDVVIKYRFSSVRRLVTIQLDEMRLLQQVSATKTKGNDCSEVDIHTFERPKGTHDGFVTFTVNATSGKGGGTGDEGDEGDDGDDDNSSSASSASSRSVAAGPAAAAPTKPVRSTLFSSGASLDVIINPALQFV
jgi:hypothetical protein